MTREIIEGAKEVFIPYIMGELIHYNVGGNGEAHANQARKDLEEIFGLAIKALEQKPVLDKIRAEIEELDYITFDGITKRRCLEIIDKYKAESEAQE